MACNVVWQAECQLTLLVLHLRQVLPAKTEPVAIGPMTRLPLLLSWTLGLSLSVITLTIRLPDCSTPIADLHQIVI